MPKLRYYPQKQFVVCLNPKSDSKLWKWLKFVNGLNLLTMLTVKITSRIGLTGCS